MCGIIGYVGLDDAKKALIKGLQTLEYRGYDSAKLIAIALQNASDMSDPDAVREAVLGITDHEGIAGTYNFSDGSGDGLTTARAYIVSGGKNVLFADWLAENPQ